MIHLILWRGMTSDRAVASAGCLAPLFPFQRRQSFLQRKTVGAASAATHSTQMRLHSSRWELEASRCNSMHSKLVLAEKPELCRQKGNSPQDSSFNRPRCFDKGYAGPLTAPEPWLRNSSLWTARLSKRLDLGPKALPLKVIAAQAQIALVAALCAAPLAGFAGSPAAARPSGQLSPLAGAPKEAPQPKPFDPTLCKGGENGYVYWAARDQVFKFRFDPALPLYPRLGRIVMRGEVVAAGMTEIPPAPDPSAPEGCFGNPLRGRSVPYMREFSDKLFLITFGVA